MHLKFLNSTLLVFGLQAVVAFTYIYIFFAFALDESVILDVLQFPV